MPPPPVTAAVLRARPLTNALVGAWVTRDVEHNAAAKIQNIRIISVFNHIDRLTDDIHRIEDAIRGLNLQTLDALQQGDVAKARQLLARQADHLEALGVKQEAIDQRVAEGLDLEQEDVLRETARTTDNQHKLARIQEARRADGPTGPGGAA